MRIDAALVGKVDRRVPGLSTSQTQSGASSNHETTG